MTVRVRLFGPEARAAGERAVAVDLAERATCAALRDALGSRFPALREALGHARFAVNNEFAEDDRVIEADDEVALIGLVSGG